jgi:hypothetical protein
LREAAPLRDPLFEGPAADEAEKEAWRGGMARELEGKVLALSYAHIATAERYTVRRKRGYRYKTLVE